MINLLETWTLSASTNIRRCRSKAVVKDHVLYVMGGIIDEEKEKDGDDFTIIGTDTVECYVTTQGTWTFASWYLVQDCSKH